MRGKACYFLRLGSFSVGSGEIEFRPTDFYQIPLRTAFPLLKLDEQFFLSPGRFRGEGLQLQTVIGPFCWQTTGGEPSLGVVMLVPGPTC